MILDLEYQHWLAILFGAYLIFRGRDDIIRYFTDRSE